MSKRYDYDLICSLAHLYQHEIAERVGCSRATVSKVLRDAGLSRGKGHGTGNRGHNRILTDQQFRTLQTSRRPAKVLAKKYGVSPWTVYAIRHGTNTRIFTDETSPSRTQNPKPVRLPELETS